MILKRAAAQQANRAASDQRKNHIEEFKQWVTDRLDSEDTNTLHRFANKAGLVPPPLKQVELANGEWATSRVEVMNWRVGTWRGFWKEETEQKLTKLIQALKEQGFAFLTYSDLRRRLSNLSSA